MVGTLEEARKSVSDCTPEERKRDVGVKFFECIFPQHGADRSLKRFPSLVYEYVRALDGTKWREEYTKVLQGELDFVLVWRTYVAPSYIVVWYTHLSSI